MGIHSRARPTFASLLVFFGDMRNQQINIDMPASIGDLKANIVPAIGEIPAKMCNHFRRQLVDKKLKIEKTKSKHIVKNIYSKRESSSVSYN